MNKIISTCLLAFFLILANACTYIQIPFPNEIQGNEAKKKIMDTIMTTEIVIYTQYPNLITPDSPYYNALISNMMFEEQELFQDVFVPALIRINEKKMYKLDTVEKCMETIQFEGLYLASQGMIYPDILATIQCNVEEAGLLQIGKFNLL